MDTNSHLRVVLCCFLDKHYLDEAYVCIQSLRHVGKFAGRVDMFTDLLPLSEKWQEIGNVYCHQVTEVHSIADGAGYRLRMLDLLEWKDTDIFLYLDTDIVCVHDMSLFLQHAHSINEKLHVYGHNDNSPQRITQKHPCFAGQLSKDPNIVNQVAWCSGILLFRPSTKMKQLLKRTQDMYNQILKNNQVTKVWEQPSLCLVFCQENHYETSLDPFTCEYRYHIPTYRSKHMAKPPGEHVTFTHFCDLRGHQRKRLMENTFQSAIAPSKQT